MAARILHPGQARGFASTHWTTIRACAGSDSIACQAREQLCRDYWYPLYAYIKRSGCQGCDAEDLTQDFFAYVLNRPWFERADQNKGHFRSFLLGSLDKFLSNQNERRKTRKRGGGYQHIPLDVGSAESRYARGFGASITPAQIYEVEWATELVSISLRRLENEYRRGGRAALFSGLKIFMTILGDANRYQESAQTLQMSVENVKVTVHRLRKRYGEILREEVARTVGTFDDVDSEVRHVREVLAAACI